MDFKERRANSKDVRLEFMREVFHELKDDHKDIVKEAFKDWLDEKSLEFGKWTFKFLATAVFGALLYFLVTHGFIK